MFPGEPGGGCVWTSVAVRLPIPVSFRPMGLIKCRWGADNEPQGSSLIPRMGSELCEEVLEGRIVLGQAL